MLTSLNAGAFAAFLLSTAAAVWIALVPHTVSSAAFVWSIGGMLLFGIFAAAMIDRARPTRSVAHLLHDTEHPSTEG